MDIPDTDRNDLMTEQLTPERIAELDPNGLVEELDTNLEEGLGESEAQARLDQWGSNTIEEESQSPLLRLLSHFWGPIPWMIEIAVVLSAVAGRWEDFGVILTMLLINGGVGFSQEHKAQNEIEALKQQLSPRARVLRDKKIKTINAQDLVPGDTIRLRMGDVVPADIKIFGQGDLSIDESALTGESLPVAKEEGTAAYSGTSVKRGEATAIVTNTGNHTRFARTVELVAHGDEKSHFQKAVLRIGYYLIGLTALLISCVVGLGVVRGDPVWEVLLFALVLTIAGIPHALPAGLAARVMDGVLTNHLSSSGISKEASVQEMELGSFPVNRNSGNFPRKPPALWLVPTGLNNAAHIELDAGNTGDTNGKGRQVDPFYRVLGPVFRQAGIVEIRQVD